MANKTIIDGQVCIWLQCFGWASAKPASAFMTGDKVLYNFGSVYTITEIKELSACFLQFTEQCRDGKTYTRKAKKDRLFAFIKPK
ncbi:hypothetical protein LZZ85_11460 [Terrimonas sp. NA20]|uniref:Uncharacterized protein n=1 Tax=Terrimonas ginsenosidimutans TaxID=2908004 RepID=A0ABS9KRG3_9BACT|nr:hypothetical protein [Terrimonas ginsenosidimutans]MCG2614906.1 hypothetical protein [Terrimonas ginsenosidimutans]